MFNNVGLKTKMFAGFMAVVALLVMTAFISFIELDIASEGFKEYRVLARDTNLAGRLQANMLMVRMNVKDFIITGSEKDHGEYDDYLTEMNTFLDQAHAEILQPERADIIDQVSTKVLDYEKDFDKVVSIRAERDNLVNSILNVKGPLMEKTLTDILESAYTDNDQQASYNSGLAMKHLLLARLYMAKFLDSNDIKAAERVFSEFKLMDEQLQILDQELKNQERRDHLAVVIDSKNIYQTTFKKLEELILARNEIVEKGLDVIGPQVASAVEDVKLSVKADQDALGPRLQESNEKAVLTLIVISLVAIVTGLFLAFVITNSVIKPFKEIFGGLTRFSKNELNETGEKFRNVVDGMSASAGQVASAAEQSASAGQDLANTSSEQASSVEEVSSSLEQLSAMIVNNADNTRQADTMSSNAAESMKKMNQTILDIKGSSDETAKIIKTIDEIAFQTNLLALNAAVEAARAGEAGKGFAVVAEEVRNLAMRSASAAKTTSDLIEGSQIAAGNGVKVSQEVSGIIENTRALIANINVASKEQAEGVQQLNNATSEIDKITQNVAANSEETASAAEELSAQALELNSLVDVMKGIIGKNRNTRKLGHSSNGHVAGKKDYKKLASPKIIVPNRRMQHVLESADEVIALDDSDLDF